MGQVQATRAFSVTVAALAAACSAQEPACKVVVVRAALVNGSARAGYLALDRREEAAVVEVRLRFSTEPFREMCSGVLVAERVVLTARHCLHDLEPSAVEVVFEVDDSEPRVTMNAGVAAVHSTLDVLALTLTDDRSAEIDAMPLPIADALPTGLGPSSLVQISGFGADADGGVGDRRFLVAVIEQVEPETLVVSSDRLGGACFGDSGGPLLARADDGSVRTLGLLKFGTANCFGSDHYARVDGLASWAADVGLKLEAPPASSTDARLGAVGRCFDNRAVWFEEGNLQAAICNGRRGCGWSREARGYRCVLPDEDDCGGIDELGTCRDGQAVTCASGRLDENPCGTCGFSCRRSPQTGAATCL